MTMCVFGVGAGGGGKEEEEEEEGSLIFDRLLV